MIRLEELGFQYTSLNPVITNICKDFCDGQIHAIVGSNGSGKSTLLKLITGVLFPTEGTVSIGTSLIQDIQPSQLAKIIAFVPQNITQPFPFTVRDMVMMGRSSYLKPMSMFFGDDDYQLSTEAMERLGILRLQNEVFSNISGGEQQLTLIARALAQNTQHIVLDEPTAYLDLSHQHMVMKVLYELQKEGKCVILVMHDLELAIDWADTMTFLKNGKIAASGQTQSIVSDEVLTNCFGTKLKVLSLPESNTKRVVFDV